MKREFSNRVIGCAIAVHRIVGPEWLESTYQQCLAHKVQHWVRQRLVDV